MSNLNNPYDPYPRDYPRILGVNKWGCPGWMTTTQVNTVIGAGRIYYSPVFVNADQAFDRIGIYVQAGDGVGGLADLRRYSFVDGMPVTQLSSYGTVSTNALGAQEIVIAETWARGFYFLALRGDQAPTLHGVSGSNVGKVPVDGQQVTNAVVIGDLCVLSVVDALADPAPTPTFAYNAGYHFFRMRRV